MILVETKRLTVRQFTRQDAAFMLELLNSPGWLQNIGDRGVRTLEDAETYITERLQVHHLEHGFGYYLVALQSDQSAIGMVGLVKRDGLAHVDIGFAFLPEHHGKGYAYESTKALLDYAREELQLDPILAIANPDNERSHHLLRKIGLQFEGNITLPGETKEIWQFSTSDSKKF